jgi:hypothetical protein
VFLVFYLMIKWTLKMFWAMLWLYWALIALTVAFILSVTGHDRAARQWKRSLNWRRVF